MAEKLVDTTNDLHILVDMEDHRVFVSFHGNTKAAQNYKASASERFKNLRHIRVITETGEIRVAKENGDVVE